MSDKKTVIGVLLIAFASMLWGFDGVVLTPRLNNLDVILVVFVLHALPFVLMNALLYKRYKELKKLDRTAFYSLIVVSFFGGALGTIAIVKALFAVGFQQLSVVVLLQKFQPVFAIFLASVFLKERLTKQFFFWGGIAIIAGYFLTFGLHFPTIQSDDNTLKAALLSLLAAFSFGASTVFSKNLLDKVDFVSATFFRYGMTSLLMLPLVVALGLQTDFANFTTQNWVILIIISLTTGSGAILLYYYGLKYVKASISTIAELFFPLSAILFDFFINHNSLTLVQWISATIMIFAVIKASMKK